MPETGSREKRAKESPGPKALKDLKICCSGGKKHKPEAEGKLPESKLKHGCSSSLSMLCRSWSFGFMQLHVVLQGWLWC